MLSNDSRYRTLIHAENIQIRSRLSTTDMNLENDLPLIPTLPEHQIPHSRRLKQVAPRVRRAKPQPRICTRPSYVRRNRVSQYTESK